MIQVLFWMMGVQWRVLTKSSRTYKLAAERDIKPNTTQIVICDNYYEREVQGVRRARNRKTHTTLQAFWEIFLKKFSSGKINKSSAKTGVAAFRPGDKSTHRP